ncbi:MAG: hypothetical protein QT00_C0002G0465 [archaeon GW2011_AR5]|nr:MAG: hypothetical protein QT00_C0002G0465 [archaeon GW2011_AR5]
MPIPEPYKSILESNIGLVKSDSDVKAFVEKCFSDLLVKLGKNLGFQSRAKKTGDMFELLFDYLMEHKYKVKFSKCVPIKKACMLGSGALDFGIMKNGKLLCGIEAKGSAEVVDGIRLPRPALKRTDTMKKAISQAYQFKRVFPKTPFYIVTNVKPKNGNAECMMNLAEGDIVDKFIDITNPKELQEFLNKVKPLM